MERVTSSTPALQKQFAMALETHLTQGGEAALLEAYELGRTVLTEHLGVLGVAWIAARGRTAWLGNATGAQPEFEDAPAGRVLTLDLSDSRVLPSSANATPHSSADRPLPD